jgi:hypothetical protein
MQASKGGIPNASNQNIFGTLEGANNAINKGDLTSIFGVSEGANDHHLAHYMALPHHLRTLNQNN